MFSTYNTWLYNRLSTLSDVSVYNHPATQVNYPALIIIALSSNGIRKTNRHTEREYSFEIRIEFPVSDNFKALSNLESDFLTLVDNVIAKFEDQRTTRNDTGINDIVEVGDYELGFQIRENPIRWAKFNLTFRKLNDG